MQNRIVDILEKGGVVTIRVKLHGREDKRVIESKLIDLVTGYVDESKEIDKTLTTEQVSLIKDLLKDLGETGIQLIGNCAWRSIAVFLQCISLDLLIEPEKLYKCWQLKIILERLFRVLLGLQEYEPELIQTVRADFSNCKPKRGHDMSSVGANQRGEYNLHP